jgi:multidrug efflux pump
MTSSITAPLERQFGQMPGLNQMSSRARAARRSSRCSSASSCARRRRAGGAGGDQRRATFLPSDLPQPPIYSKVNPADTPIVTLALTSKTLPLPQIRLADTRLRAEDLAALGRGLVSISGGQRPAVRIQANPKALARTTCRSTTAHRDRRTPIRTRRKEASTAPRGHRRSTPTTSCAPPANSSR